MKKKIYMAALILSLSCLTTGVSAQEVQETYESFQKQQENIVKYQKLIKEDWHNTKAHNDLGEVYLKVKRLEEAEKRDHRKIGKNLDLFHHQEEASGMVFWHDNGWRIYREVEQYIRDVLQNNGYQEVRTPQVVDRSLWEKSGHWDKFGDMIFSTHSENHIAKLGHS